MSAPDFRTHQSWPSRSAAAATPATPDTDTVPARPSEHALIGADPAPDHSACTPEQIAREFDQAFSAGDGADEDYYLRMITLLGLPAGGAGMVSDHEWSDEQFEAYQLIAEAGDTLEWVPTLMGVEAAEARGDWDYPASEAYIAAEQRLAVLANHDEACDYGLKASATEVRDHLLRIVRTGTLGQWSAIEGSCYRVSPEPEAAEFRDRMAAEWRGNTYRDVHEAMLRREALDAEAHPCPDCTYPNAEAHPCPDCTYPNGQHEEGCGQVPSAECRICTDPELGVREWLHEAEGRYFTEREAVRERWHTNSHCWQGRKISLDEYQAEEWDRDQPPSDVSSMGEGPEVASHVDYPAVRFSLDDGPAWDGWHDGTFWNGAANVLVTPEVRDQIVAHLRERYPEEDVADLLAIEPTPEGRIYLGGGAFMARLLPYCSQCEGGAAGDPAHPAEGVCRWQDPTFTTVVVLDPRPAEAAERLLSAWEYLQTEYHEAKRYLSPSVLARTEAYVDQLFDPSSRMLGMQSPEQWLRDMAADLRGEASEESEAEA